MTETTVETKNTKEVTKRLMLSGRNLLDKLGKGETLKLDINGFYRAMVSGETKEGHRKFSGVQYRFIPKNDTDPAISIMENSAGGKMLVRQINAFKEQFEGQNKGELGHYESTVEFTHVAQIKDKTTGELKDVDFLSVKIDPKSLGKRVFTPSAQAFNFEIHDDDKNTDTTSQLNSFDTNLKF